MAALLKSVFTITRADYKRVLFYIIFGHEICLLEFSYTVF